MSLRELWSIFFRLGLISFGGPVAHIALMQREWVERRGAMSNQEFLDLSGAMSLIPGPNSTELAMAIGRRQGGQRGLWLAGAAFILPAFCIVLLIAWFYARYGQLPLTRAVLWGVGPIVIAVIANAGFKLAPVALKNRFAQIVFALALVLALSGRFGEIAILFGAALLGFIWGKLRPAPPLQVLGDEKIEPKPETTPRQNGAFLLAAPLASWGTTGSLLVSFLKIGSILYGSGYVLIAFLRDEFVPHWLSDAQLLDAVSVGQFTPGPVFTTATFIGFQIGVREGLASGFAGAIAATIGIFLPSFLLVQIALEVLKRAQNSPYLRGFLDAVNAASLALMGAVCWGLARGTLVDATTIAMAVLALGALQFSKINAAWLMGAGALCGLLMRG